MEFLSQFKGNAGDCLGGRWDSYSFVFLAVSSLKFFIRILDYFFLSLNLLAVRRRRGQRVGMCAVLVSFEVGRELNAVIFLYMMIKLSYFS